MSEDSLKEPINKKQQEAIKQLAEDVVSESHEAVYKRLSIMGFIVMGINVVCVIALVVIATLPAKPPQILTVDRTGQVTPINAYDTPPASSSVLLSLAQKYVRELMDFNAINYDRRLDENREIFIGDSFHNAYEAAVKESGWFESLVTNKLSMTAIPDGVPVISNPGGSVRGDNNARVWLVKVPVQLYLEGPGVRPRTLKRVFAIELVHVRQHEYQAGIGVANIKSESR